MPRRPAYNSRMRGTHLGPVALLAMLLLSLAPASASAATADGIPRSFDRSVGPAPALPPAARDTSRRLGAEGRISISAATGTPRHLARTDRALTGPDGRDATSVALAYLRRHRDLFRLSDRELERLGPPRVTVSPNGTSHLSWRQTRRGLPVAGADLRAHVAADGRILAIGGGPLVSRPDVTRDRDVSGGQALRRTRGSVGLAGEPTPDRVGPTGDPAGSRFEDGSTTRLVVAATAGGPRLAWSVINANQGPAGAQAALVDANDGALLSRRQLTRGVSGQARVWDARPTDPRSLISFPDRWATTDTALRGDFAYVYADVLGEGEPTVDEHGIGGEIAADDEGPGGVPFWDETYEPITSPFDPVEDPLGGLGCSPLYPCSWSSFRPRSWVDNLRQATVQTFVFLNRFHDHLAADPIGFDATSGNFETTTPGGTDGDPIHAVTFIGAAGNGGVPAGHHRNNARMSVMPDGDALFPSRMLLYMFGVGDDRFDVIDGNSAEHAMIVYHEYGHGLVGRLVTDANGINAMNLVQAGALNEGLSDFYALDYLEATGGLTDDPAVPGEILAAGELTGGKLGMRESAVDCPVGASDAELCPAGGGFTYADFAKIFHDEEGRPGFEYHADGEIFTQTLWDLRSALIAAHGRTEGIRRTRELVTEGLRLTPTEPDYLELRDSILLADVAAGSPDRDLIWRVFAARGMGVDAESAGPVDSSPWPGFAVPDPQDPPDPPGPDPDPDPPGPDPDPPADPDDPEPPDLDRSRPRIRLALPRRSLRALRSRQGLPLRVSTDRPVRLTATLAAPAGEARRRGLTRKARPMRLAAIEGRRLAAGRPTLRLRPNRRAKRKLARVRQLRAKLVVRATDRQGRRSARLLRPLLRR